MPPLGPKGLLSPLQELKEGHRAPQTSSNTESLPKLNRDFNNQEKEVNKLLKEKKVI